MTFRRLRPFKIHIFLHTSLGVIAFSRAAEKELRKTGEKEPKTAVKPSLAASTY